MIIFISYSKTRDSVIALAKDLENLGHQVWFDKSQQIGLVGGQDWWSEILRNIRMADLIVVALSPTFLSSEACAREISYAQALQKQLLPVLVQNINVSLLPPSLARIEFVDYLDTSNRDSLLKLVKALSILPPPSPLPDPLPTPPDAPVSRLGQLATQVRSSTPMNYEQQAALVFELKSMLNTTEYEGAKDLLAVMNNRNDLLARVATEIEQALARPGSEARTPTPKATPVQAPSNPSNQASPLERALEEVTQSKPYGNLAVYVEMALRGKDYEEIPLTSQAQLTFSLLGGALVSIYRRKKGYVILTWFQVTMVVYFPHITVDLLKQALDTGFQLAQSALPSGMPLGWGRGLALSLVIASENVPPSAVNALKGTNNGEGRVIYPVIYDLTKRVIHASEFKVAGLADFDAETRELFR